MPTRGPEMNERGGSPARGALAWLLATIVLTAGACTGPGLEPPGENLDMGGDGDGFFNDDNTTGSPGGENTGGTGATGGGTGGNGAPTGGAGAGDGDASLDVGDGGIGIGDEDAGV